MVKVKSRGRRPRPWGAATSAELYRIARERGITQREIAEMTGMSQGTVSRLLLNKQDLCHDDMLALCAALGVDPWEVTRMAAQSLGEQVPY